MVDMFYRRVHISESTFQCLNGAYEVEDGNGQERDAYLRVHDVKTYLIKQIEPKKTRRRLQSRPRYLEAYFSKAQHNILLFLVYFPINCGLMMTMKCLLVPREVPR